MGVFTGHTRTATIAADQDSAGLAIRRDVLRTLMSQDRGLSVRILENVVELLSDRLADANLKVHQLRLENESFDPEVQIDPPEEDGAAEAGVEADEANEEERAAEVVAEAGEVNEEEDAAEAAAESDEANEDTTPGV